MVNILVPNEFLILFGRNIFPLIESTCGLRDGFLRALDDHPIVESSFKPQVRSGKSPDELYCLSHQIQIQIQNIARIANAVQVTICLLVSTSVY